MRLKPAVIESLAKFICGDDPLPFPYRSSSKLTSFFQGLGLPHVHRNESRNPWTNSVVAEINNRSSPSDQLPSGVMVSLIEEIANPAYFQTDSDKKINYESALEMVNRVLRQSGLILHLDPVLGIPKLNLLGDTPSPSTAAPVPVNQMMFTPKIFTIPDPSRCQHDLVALMMPFGKEFADVHTTIKHACSEAGMRCKRADDIWANTTVLQDIVDLICVATIVIVDLTSRNANVLYETGIAHALGKQVLPITQSIEHVPFDLQSHRVLRYLPNSEGLVQLKAAVKSRLITLTQGHSWEAETQ